MDEIRRVDHWPDARIAVTTTHRVERIKAENMPGQKRDARQIGQPAKNATQVTDCFKYIFCLYAYQIITKGRNTDRTHSGTVGACCADNTTHPFSCADSNNNVPVNCVTSR